MSTPNSHQPSERKVPGRSETRDDTEFTSAESPVKPPPSSATLLAIFALIGLGLLILLLIGEVGIFEIGS